MLLAASIIKWQHAASPFDSGAADEMGLATLVGLQLMDVAADATVAGKGLPLVLISHGNDGGLASHADLAMALARRDALTPRRHHDPSHDQAEGEGVVGMRKLPKEG
jgi:hypothetical protein